VYCFIVCLSYPQPYTIIIYHTPMVQYSRFVLKVLLNSNQLTFNTVNSNMPTWHLYSINMQLIFGHSHLLFT